MAEAYRTDEEQVEAIKKWWSQNGISTLVSIAIVVIAFFGWQGWQKSQQDEIDTASALYQDLVTATSGNDGEMSEAEKATARHLADTLKTDYPQSTYAQFAAFYNARLAVETNDLDTAETELRWVLARNPGQPIAIQTHLRLARVLAAKEDYQQALELLNIDAGGYASAFAEARGDIYRAGNDTEKALAAYEKALQINQQTENTQPNRLLDMKIQQMKSERGSAAANRAKTEEG